MSGGEASPQSFSAGFIDREGRIVIPDKFEDAGRFQERCAPVQIEKSWGIVNPDGELIFPCQWRFPVRFVNGFAMVREIKSGRERRGFLRRDGEWIVRPKYVLATAFSCGLAQVFDGIHYGFVDERGNEEVPLIFEDSRHFSEHLAPVKSKNRWGYIDTAGRFVIQPMFDLALPLCEGVARVQQGDKWGLIDHSGEWIVNPKFALLWDMHCGRSAAQVGRSMGFINSEGDLIIEPSYTYVSSFQEDLAWVTRTGQKSRVCIDLFGREVFPGAFVSADPFYQGRSLVETESSIGYLDHKGRWVWRGAFVERSVIF